MVVYRVLPDVPRELVVYAELLRAEHRAAAPGWPQALTYCNHALFALA